MQPSQSEVVPEGREVPSGCMDSISYAGVKISSVTTHEIVEVELIRFRLGAGLRKAVLRKRTVSFQRRASRRRASTHLASRIVLLTTCLAVEVVVLEAHQRLGDEWIALAKIWSAGVGEADLARQLGHEAGASSVRGGARSVEDVGEEGVGGALGCKEGGGGRDEKRERSAGDEVGVGEKGLEEGRAVCASEVRSVG